MSTRKLFGTDGIRGVANVDPMTVEMAVKLGRAAAYVFKNGDKRHAIVIGKDTRLSGYMLENALVAGICSLGVDVLLVGPLPTPAIAFITRSVRADAGIVISASHNPYQDNGIKFFSADGLKLPDAVEATIEQMIFSGAIDDIRPTAEEVGKAFRLDDAVGRYIENVKYTFPRGMTLDGYRVVVDCANGAAYKAAPRVFFELGAETIILNDRPDGVNINRECGSLCPQVTQAAVREHDATLGVSLDGDADRVIFVDETGSIVDGDAILAICARHMIRRGTLAGNTVVATTMSNGGLESALREVGGTVVRTQVGDRYIIERMLANGYNFGGEQSGHLIFADHSTTGDGLIAALQILAIMKERGEPLSQLTTCFTPLPQVLRNVRVRKRVPLERVPAIQECLKEVQGRLGEEGRVLVRYSGTELLCRVMVEGPDQALIHSLAEKLVRAIERGLGEHAPAADLPAGPGGPLDDAPAA